MGAQLEPQDEHFVTEVAASFAEWAWFGLVTVVVYMLFIPLFVYGAAISVRQWLTAVVQPTTNQEVVPHAL